MCLKMCEASPCAWYSLTLSEPVQARQSENTSIPQGLRRLGLALIPAQHPSHLLGTTLISSADEPALQTLSNHILLKWHRLENFSHLIDQLNRQRYFCFIYPFPHLSKSNFLRAGEYNFVSSPRWHAVALPSLLLRKVIPKQSHT